MRGFSVNLCFAKMICSVITWILYQDTECICVSFRGSIDEGLLSHTKSILRHVCLLSTCLAYWQFPDIIFQVCLSLWVSAHHRDCLWLWSKADCIFERNVGNNFWSGYLQNNSMVGDTYIYFSWPIRPRVASSAVWGWMQQKHKRQQKWFLPEALAEFLKRIWRYSKSL